MENNEFVDIVFDAMPGPHGAQFIEVEDAAGKSLRYGEWLYRPDGAVALRIPRGTPVPDPFTESLHTNNVLTALMAVRDEVTRAQSLWPRPFSCAHEGWAVILEELDELWDEVKLNQKKRDLDQMRKEAVQVAAMAIRFIVEVIDEGRGRE